MNETDKDHPADEEPRIIVDDDYKQQVEREKERIREELESATASNAQPGEMEMPPASMPVLITTLATQALSNLGQIPDPVEGQPVIRKPLAKHFIDTLALLEEKTQGNLSGEEAEMLTGTLHQLRMIFVAVPDAMPEPEDKGSSSSIELP